MHAGVGADPELLTIERVAILQRVSFFESIPGHQLVSVARAVEEVRIPPGTTFIERGAVEDWFYVVAEGTVRAHLGDRTLSHRGPGQVVGELAVLSPAARSASVTSEGHVLLLRLRRGPFDELLEDNPGVARAVIATLASRLQELADEETTDRETTDEATTDGEIATNAE